MYCTYVFTIASLKMFLRNRQAIFFSMFVPLVMLLLFGAMDFDKPSKMRLGLVTHNPAPPTALFLQRLRAVPNLAIDEGTLESERASLKNGNRTAVLDIPDDLLAPLNGGEPRQLSVYVNAGRPIEEQMAMIALNQIADETSLVMARVQPVFTIKREAVDVHNFRYIEFLLPGIIAMSVMQMSVFSIAYGFAQYKEKGVLKRLLATPMRPYQFVTATIITRLCMAVAQAFIFILLGGMMFHIPIVGAWWLLTVCVVLGSLAFLGLGFTVSGLSKSTDSVPVLANLVVFPMMFTCNIFFPIGGMPPWLQHVASYLPLTFFANALRAVITDGAGPAAIKGDVIGMFVWSAILITLATVTFRFQEREGT